MRHNIVLRSAPYQVLISTANLRPQTTVKRHIAAELILYGVFITRHLNFVADGEDSGYHCPV